MRFEFILQTSSVSHKNFVVLVFLRNSSILKDFGCDVEIFLWFFNPLNNPLNICQNIVQSPGKYFFTSPNPSCNYSQSEKCFLWCQIQTNSSPRFYRSWRMGEFCLSTQGPHKHVIGCSFTKCWVISILQMICTWSARVSFMWHMIAFISGGWSLLSSGSVVGGCWIRFSGRRVFQKVSWW